MKLKTLKLLAMAASFSAAGIASFANEAQIKLLTFTYMDTRVSAWIEDDALLATVRAANEARAGLSDDDVLALDQRWRDGDQSVIAPVMDGEASALLKALCDGSRGVVTELILMDALGLNVGQCGPSSDFWQGDEAKHQETYLEGPDAIFVDQIERDDSTGRDQLQASITVTDPETGEAIGALTVGLDAEFLLEE